MQTNRYLTLMSLLVMGFSLTACTSTQSTSTSKTTPTESASSSVPKPPADKANIKPYQVPTDDRRNPNYQKSGLLRLPGQFSYDTAGTKLTLKKTQTLSKKTHSNGFEVTVTGIKVIDNQAKTSQAKQMAQQAFSLAKLPNHYRTIQLKFKMTNLRRQTVLTDGVKNVTVNGSSQVSSVGGLSDASAGKPIAAKQSHTFTAMILAGQPQTQVSQLTIHFSGSFSLNGTPLSPAPAPINLSL